MEIRLNRASIETILLAVPLAFAGLGAGHADEQKLTGPQITEILEGTTVSGTRNGQPWEQDFQKGGITVFRAVGESPSEGRWRVKSDQFCSQWPPARAWVCYDIVRNGEIVSFVPTDGGDVWRANVQAD